MTQIDFGRFTDRGRSGQVSSYRLINGYAEKQGQGQGQTGKGPLPVYGVPGFVRWDDGDYEGVIRGSHKVRNKGLYAVLGNELVRFIGGPSHAVIGAVSGFSATQAAGGLGFVTMASNMKGEPQLGIVTEDGLYYHLETGADVLTLYAGADLPKPRSIDFLDRYFLFAIEDGRFFHTGLDDAGNINALSFAYAESNADGLVGVFAHRGAAIALGEESMEIFENAGTQPFAFTPTRADIEVGCASLPSVTRVKDGLAWVDQDSDVQLMRGSEPEAIGTPDLSRLIYALSDNARARLKGDYYSFGKKRFYALSSDNWTWEFDLAEGVWHERRSRGRPNWLAQCVTKFDGDYIAGSRVDGKLYRIDGNVYSEDGDAAILRAQSQTVHFFPRGGKCHKLTVDMITGEGSIGEDDYLMLESSTDGGANWVNHGAESIGRLGERNKRVQWRQLGRFDEKGVIFALSSSAAVLRGIVNVDADIVPLAR